MVEWFIARRLAGAHQRSFTKLILRIATAAVALSLLVMVVATAMINGFQEQIARKIFNFWGHLVITNSNVIHNAEMIPISSRQAFYPSLDTLGGVTYLSPSYWSFDKQNPHLVEKPTHGGVHNIQVFAQLPGILKTKNQFEGILLKGVGPDFEWDHMKGYIEEGRPVQMSDTSYSREILLSRQTADRLQLKVNDKLIVNFVVGGEQIRKRLDICGIYKTGLEEFDKKVALVDIGLIRDVLEWDSTMVSGFEVFFEDIRDLDPLSEYIYSEVLPQGLYAETIQEKFPAIFEWLALQNINKYVILGLMLLVAIINMATALLILILERTNMIGILKAMGARNWTIQRIFLIHALYIIGYGLLIGNTLGLGLCYLQQQYGFIRLNEADYYLSQAPISFNWMTIAGLNLGMTVIILVCLLLPSWIITRIKPVQAIRFS